MLKIFDDNNLDIKGLVPRTYYVKIECLCEFGENVIATFFKFGKSSRPLKTRFSSEKGKIIVTILKIWPHPDASCAKDHEEWLFETYKPVRPFYSFLSCPASAGPLSTAKGNTELILGDCMSRKRKIKMPKAKFIVDYTFSGHFYFYRHYVNSKQKLCKEGEFPGWMEWLSFVPDNCVFLPRESFNKNRLIFISESYLNTDDYFYGSKRKREEWLEEAQYVSSFDEAEKLSCIYTEPFDLFERIDGC